MDYLFSKCIGPCGNATLVRRVWCSSLICNQDERPLSTRRCIPSHCANQSIYKNLTTTSTIATKVVNKISKPTSTTTKPTTTIKKPPTKSARTHPFTVAKKNTAATTTATTIRHVKSIIKTTPRRG